MCCWLIGQIKQHSAVRRWEEEEEDSLQGTEKEKRKIQKALMYSTSKEKKYYYFIPLITCMCTDKRLYKRKIEMTRLNVTGL